MSEAKSSGNDKSEAGYEFPRVIFSSPHVFTPWSTAKIMWSVSLCLAPAALWGVYVFGFRALLVLVLSIFSCAASEYLWTLLQKGNQLYHNRSKKSENTLEDGSAVLSGLLLGMNLSPLVPWYIPVLGGIFAMLVCKWSFGGLGANWVNPALAGRAFVFFSFGQAMSLWPVPQRGTIAVDASSAATPLSAFKEQLIFSHSQALPEGSLALSNWSSSQGISDSSGILQLLFGMHGGSLGEVASLLILLGGLAMLAMGIIRWHIPLSFLGVFGFLTWAFGGLYLGRGYFAGELLFHLFSGGLMLGAWFMATDMVSSPKTPRGQLIFGAGCGLLTFLIRFYGSYPEGVMLAILFMNIWTPTIDVLIRPRILGTGKKAKKSLSAEAPHLSWTKEV